MISIKSTPSTEKTPLSDVALLNVDTAEGTMSSRDPLTAMIDLEGVKSRQKAPGMTKTNSLGVF